MDSFLEDLSNILYGSIAPAEGTVNRMESTWYRVYDSRCSLDTAVMVLNAFSTIHGRLDRGEWPDQSDRVVAYDYD